MSEKYDIQYDNTSPKSIEQYAKRLINHTFEDMLKWDSLRLGESTIKASSKGEIGNLVEKHYFSYAPNSNSKADFEKAGVELKVSPYEISKNGKCRAGERLVLTMISYTQPVEYDFYKSHLWKKCALLLLIYYLRDRELANKYLQIIKYVSLFTPPEEDLEIIKQDYKKIIDKIAAGKAHELSESDTMYLGACTKGATAESSLKPQYYSRILAKRRAFCYKNSYMTYVLNNYLIPGINTYNEADEPNVIQDDVESLTNASELRNKTFDDVIKGRIDRYIGKSDRELCDLFGREYNDNKAQWNNIVYRMLGIKSNNAEEFVKAQIVVKVIRIEENGSMRESMSLPPFKYCELIQESWEDSTLHNYFDETRFLFVTFKKHGNEYYLKGCQFWNMPYSDLNETVMTGWQNVVKTIQDGVRFNFTETKTGVVVENNLPGKNDNAIIHVRPHASKRYYLFNDGRQIGDGNKSHANQLPDGTWMPNYSFWINNSYILSQLDDSIK